MTCIGLHGLRGGVGNTSLLAGLGYALQALGERVLLLDMCPENQLRLHCNLPFNEQAGWARADLDGLPWENSAFELLDDFYLLPYGNVQVEEVAALERALLHEPQRWSARLGLLASKFDWLLLDLPQRLPGHCTHGHLDIFIRVLEADAACHALLLQQESASKGVTAFLVNKLDSSSQLQRDLLLVWKQYLGDRLLAQIVHRDESVAAALANKSPIGHFLPHGQASQDLQSLATWCLARRRAS